MKILSWLKPKPLSDAEKLKAYDKAIKLAIRVEDEFVFPNQGVEHAQIMLANLIENTHRNLLVYAESLDSEVANCEQYFDAFALLNRRNIIIKLLLNNKPDKNNPTSTINRICDKFGDMPTFQCRILPPEEKKKILRKDINFTVGDHKMFRFEYDIKESKANGSFNSPDIAESLYDLFKELYAKAKPLER